MGLGREDSARGREGTPLPPSLSAAEQAIADLINRKETVVVEVVERFPAAWTAGCGTASREAAVLLLWEPGTAAGF